MTYTTTMLNEINQIAGLKAKVHCGITDTTLVDAILAAMEGKETLIVAPTAEQLRVPENRIVQMLRLLVPVTKIRHKPFQATFPSGGRILIRVYTRTGMGLRGLHPDYIIYDEEIPA